MAIQTSTIEQSMKQPFPHKVIGLEVIPGYYAFGPGSYTENLENMAIYDSSLRPATTKESIDAASRGFGKKGKFDAKRDMFDGFDGASFGLGWCISRGLQLGYVVLTPEGVFTNTTETDSSKLAHMLNGAREFNGIYIIDDKSAFTPYESFQNWSYDNEAFVRGGLAKALEHTTEPVAPNLAKISSTQHYPEGVNAYTFFHGDDAIYNNVKEPTLKVADLSSGGGHSSGRLIVVPDFINAVDSSFMFGVK